MKSSVVGVGINFFKNIFMLINIFTCIKLFNEILDRLFSENQFLNNSL